MYIYMYIYIYHIYMYVYVYTKLIFFPEILQVLFFHQNPPAVSSPSGFEKVRGEKSTLIYI